MTPLSLTIEGLYSYQSRQKIDFQRLTEAELFGIFGATGSGKSSILEAISFALYGRTERLSSREPGGGTAYHMMNLKSNRLFIDFEFEAGNEVGKKYRFVVENRRHKTVFDKTQSFQRKIYEWGENEWLPLDVKDATQIVGLSYDHFKRTIIIPQGKFEEFIQLQSTERSKMLQDIFGLQKYERSRQVRSLQARNREAASELQGRLGEYAAISAEAIAENKAAWEQKEAERKQVLSQMQALQQQREKMEQLRQQTEQLQAQRIRLGQHLERQEYFTQRQQKLDQYIRAKDAFGVDLSEKDRLGASLQELDKRLEEKKQAQIKVEADLLRKEGLLKEVQEAYEQRDQLLREVEDWEQLLKIQDEMENLNALEARVKKGETRLQAAETQVSEYTAQIQFGESKLQRIERGRTDMEELTAVEKWLSSHAHLQEIVRLKAQQLEEILQQIETGKEEKVRMARTVGLDTSQYDLSTSKMITRLEKQEDAITIEIEELEQERLQAALHHELSRLAEGLKPGGPCPLCGSTEHPHPAQTDVLEGETVRIRTQLANLKAEQEKNLQALTGLRTLLKQAKALSPRLQAAEQALQEARLELDTHLASFIWTRYQGQEIDQIQAQIQQAREEAASIEEQRKKLKDLRDSLQREQAHIVQMRPALDTLRQKWNQGQGQYESMIESLKILSFEVHKTRATKDIYASINQLRKDHQGRIDFFQEVSQTVEALRQNQATLNGEIRGLDRDKKETVSATARLNQQIDRKVQDSGFTTEESIRQILDSALNIDAERDAIRDFDRELTELQTTLRDLEAQVGTAVFDTESFQNLLAQLALHEQQYSELNEQIGGHKSEDQRLQKAFEEKKKLLEEEKHLNLRADNLKVMESLFRGNGFVNYISTTYLENLCAAANERFLRLNHNSLHLEVDSENNFYVRDLLNGGRRRSIKTLSGGQTFQAALCLALALSDQVQQQVQARQKFFFLDEGFGSQDKESLQTIFHTLKSLRKENRIVGVISHVEELQQEIDTFLHIRNDPEEGSQVRGSWVLT